MYSQTLAAYYDVLMGDYSSITGTTVKLVSAFSQKQGLLEIGCGTGNMLSALHEKGYHVSGLDNAKHMLAVARKKVPHTPLYRADMRTFSLKKKFQTVICIFDTINHLTSFADWKRCFANVHRHLEDDGIFIFDMNTVKRLSALSRMDPFVTKLDPHTLACVKIHALPRNLYEVTFQIFRDVHEEKPRYTEEIVRESAHDIKKVKTALENYFRIEKMVDPIRPRVSAKTGRVFFVCRKKKE